MLRIAQQRLLSLPSNPLANNITTKNHNQLLLTGSTILIDITPPTTKPAPFVETNHQPNCEPLNSLEIKPTQSGNALLPFRVKFVFDNPLEVKLRPVVKRRQSSASCYSSTAHQKMALSSKKLSAKVVIIKYG